MSRNFTPKSFSGFEPLSCELMDRMKAGFDVEDETPDEDVKPEPNEEPVEGELGGDDPG